VNGWAKPGHDEEGGDGRGVSLLPSPTWLSAIPRVASRERARILAGEPMPYAVAIAGGVLFTLVSASLWFCPKTSGLKLRSQDGSGRSIERSAMANERGGSIRHLDWPGIALAMMRPRGRGRHGRWQPP
jgi:hypothetical protein